MMMMTNSRGGRSAPLRTRTSWGNLLHFSRHDSEDHKDMGGKEEKGADEMGYGKGRTKDSDGEMTGWKTRDEMGRKHRTGQSKGEACS